MGYDNGLFVNNVNEELQCLICKRDWLSEKPTYPTDELWLLLSCIAKKC